MNAMAVTRPTRSSIDLIGMLLFLPEVFFLCLPALFNGAPLVYPDTRSYFMGGKAAVDKVASLLARQPTGPGDTSVEETVQQARGVRSAFYALFTYIPAVSISLWLVILLQAIIVAVLLRLVFHLSCPDRRRWQASAFIVTLSLFSTVSWVTCNVMPDIFTSVMALSIVVTILYWPELTFRQRMWLAFAVSGSMVMHATNLPIGLGLVVVSGIVMQMNIWRAPGRFAWVTGSLIAGVFAMLFVGVVGFHQWTIAPQSPPFLLARSLQDGPAKLYLLKHCPQIGLTMCQHLDKLDQPIDVFLWDGQEGLYSTVSVDERAKIRAEDKRIYVSAALEYPWLQAQAAAWNILSQLVTFSVYEYQIPSWAEYSSTEMTLHLPLQADWHFYVSCFEYVIVIAALSFIALTWTRQSLNQKRMSIMVIATVLLEAMAGAISAPAPRYEARVIWLIPMDALLIATAMKRTATL